MIGASSFLLVLWVLLLLNLGQLVTYKLLGGKSANFVLGFGPRLANFSIGATRYELRLVPIGGFLGTDDSLPGVRSWLFLFGGPVVIVLVALGLVCAILLGGADVPDGKGAVIYWTYPEEGVQGLRIGDVVREAGHQDIGDAIDLARVLAEWKSGPRTFRVERDGKECTVDLTRHEETEDREEIAFHSSSVRRSSGPGQAILRTPWTLWNILLYHNVYWVPKEPALNYFPHTRTRCFLLKTVDCLGFWGVLALFMYAFLVVCLRVLAPLCQRYARPIPDTAWEWVVCVIIVVVVHTSLRCLNRTRPASTFESPSAMEMVQDPPLDMRWACRI